MSCLLSDGVILLCDNAWLHMAQETWNFLQISIGKCLTIPHSVQPWHPVIFICFPPWRSIFLLLRTRQTCYFHAADGIWTHVLRIWDGLISYTMKSASPFKGTMLKNGILGTKCVLSVSSIKIVPLINGYCKLIFLSTFIHMQIIHTQMWHSISHTYYIKSQAHLSLHDIFCVVLTQQHENRLYTLSIISYFS